MDPSTASAALSGSTRQAEGEKPIVLGHSWGALAAIAYGVQFPRHSAGLVLLSGFYFPRGRALLHFANIAVQPIIGPLVCRTILPPLFKLSGSLNWRAHFVPHKVPKEVVDYPFDLTSRSAQIRTFALECGLLEPGAADLAPHYRNLEVPIAILAGKGDHVLHSGEQSVRLHQHLPNSSLELLSDCGHMPHFTHLHEVLRAIDQVASAS
jgi:pimeloyl-ACP methyl ester carboxylesterase